MCVFVVAYLPQAACGFMAWMVQNESSHSPIGQASHHGLLLDRMQIVATAKHVTTPHSSDPFHHPPGLWQVIRQVA